MSAPASGFQEIDYSGDVAVEAWGSTRAEMIENATRGLMGLMAWNRVETVLERRVEANAADAGALLVEWLSQVILLSATHGEIYGDVTVESASAHEARGTVRGLTARGHEEQLRFDVKAATYHDLLVEEVAGRHHCRVVFDL
jgi:SHS2 domain-containing protein